MYFLLCLHLLVTSLYLFKMLSSLRSAIAIVSFRRNMHRLVTVFYNWCIHRISNHIWTYFFCSLNFHISFKSSVSILYFLFLKDFWWFAYHVLNLVSLISAVSVIIALYRPSLLQNLLCKGQLGLFTQLHILVWKSNCGFFTVLLCMLIFFYVFFFVLFLNFLFLSFFQNKFTLKYNQL